MSVKDSRVYWNVCRWFQGILKFLSIISVCTVMKLLINDRMVYWNFHQRFLGILKILRYTEISIDDSRVYWNFRQSFEGILKIPMVYSNFWSGYWNFCRWFWGILKFVINVLKGILIMTTRAPQAKNSVYLGILKFFSMRVGGAPGVTCNADFQFPMP